MSVFGRVVHRADGKEDRKEYDRIYHEVQIGFEEIETFNYEGFVCELYTDGESPIITIRLGAWEGDMVYKFIDAKGKENVTYILETAFEENSYVTYNYLSKNERWTMAELRQTVYNIVKKLKELQKEKA